MKVGVIAVQGSVDEHIAILRRVGVEGFKIRRSKELRDADAIIIPGGESTAISKVFSKDFLPEFLEKAREVPVMGTCAGLILLAKDIRDARVIEASTKGLGLLDISVIRNCYGRQKHSFEEEVRVEFLDGPYPGVFIRAPCIHQIYSGRSIAFLDDKPVGVMKGNIVGYTFHPELTDDTRIHEHFISFAKK